MATPERNNLPTAGDVSDDRRRFIQTVGKTALAGVVGSMLIDAGMVHAAPTDSVPVDNRVAEFHKSLTDAQKKQICFPFDHALRHKINANWNITKPTMGEDFYTDKQRAMCEGILKSITSEPGHERMLEQMDYDDGGMTAYSVALFGTPGAGPSQWVLTGRHLTMRADGNHEDKAAFGGPIVYGHGEETPRDNLYHYQTKTTNEVFESLDGEQRKKALLTKAPSETAVQVQGSKGKFPGIAIGELSDDQQALAGSALKTLLAPYAEADAAEVMSVVKDNGGVEKLHMAFYQQGDLRDDKVWDIWRVEGPNFVWHFRGAPHVHAYINIGATRQG